VRHAFSSILGHSPRPMDDQSKIFFWKKALICDSKIVKITANINKPYINVSLSK